MKIGVLSDCRVPTVPRGGHGLGRMAIDLANGLRGRGHHVTLYAGPGSEWDGALIVHQDETERAKNFARVGQIHADLNGDVPTITESREDVYLDLSHAHDLSRVWPELRVVNWLVDLECAYPPPRAVVGNAWQQKAFPSARIVPLGVDVDAIPFVAEPEPKLGRFSRETYLAFAHKLHPAKGVDLALEVGRKAQIPVHLVGQRFVQNEVPNWHGEIRDDAVLYEFLGHAAALLSPCRSDAGGRVNLESAACGTPVLTLDWSGTACHVEHCVSGFVCRDVDELAEAAGDVGLLDRAKARAWARETHDVRVMVREIEALLVAAREGETW